MSKDMSDAPVENRIDTKILEEATIHYLSLQDDSMSGAELEAWQVWFLSSKEHQDAFQRLETLWGVLDTVAYEELNPDLDRRDENDSVSPHRETEGAIFAPAPVPASVIGLVAPEKDRAESTKRPAWWYGGIAAGFALIIMAGYFSLVTNEGQILAPATPHHTASGEQRVVRLGDGSIVELGPDSSLRVRYSAAERGITLERGQAIFTVAKNPNRPFVVRAGSGSVTAIGTVFNVRQRADGVQVRVLEGTVAVRPHREEETLDAAVEPGKKVALVTAGHQTHYNQQGEMAPVNVTGPEAELAWRVGVLTMVNRELSDVIQELNRFVQNEVAIGDDAVGKFHFTGTVYPDRMDEWLEGLTKGYPLKVVRIGGRVILMLDETAPNG